MFPNVNASLGELVSFKLDHNYEVVSMILPDYTSFTEEIMFMLRMRLADGGMNAYNVFSALLYPYFSSADDFISSMQQLEQNIDAFSKTIYVEREFSNKSTVIFEIFLCFEGAENLKEEVLYYLECILYQQDRDAYLERLLSIHQKALQKRGIDGGSNVLLSILQDARELKIKQRNN